MYQTVYGSDYWFPHLFQYNVFDTEGKSKQNVKDGLQNGPMTMNMYVHDFFYSYSSGIITYKQCPSEDGASNHAMVIVGWGSGTCVDFEDQSEYDCDYMIVKNSWGSNWGEGGFVRFEMPDGTGYGTCGSYLNSFSPYKA